jgi:hypothetical protein
MKALKILSIITVLGVVAYIGWPSRNNNSQSEFNSGTFKVVDKKYRFEYELDKSETTYQGVLTMTGDQAGISEGGVVKTLHYLSDDDASDFKRVYGKSMCPAPFFNQHAKQRLLIPIDSSIEEKLSQIDFEDYRDSSKWRNFKMTGYCIKSAPILEVDGQPVQLPSNMFDDCMSIVIKSFTVSPI